MITIYFMNGAECMEARFFLSLVGLSAQSQDETVISHTDIHSLYRCSYGSVLVIGAEKSDETSKSSLDVFFPLCHSAK